MWGPLGSQQGAARRLCCTVIRADVSGVDSGDSEEGNQSDRDRVGWYRGPWGGEVRVGVQGRWS